MKKIRVLVVDDSALMRKLIPQMLATDESIEVAGTAMDGSFCLKKISTNCGENLGNFGHPSPRVFGCHLSPEDNEFIILGDGCYR